MKALSRSSLAQKIAKDGLSNDFFIGYVKQLRDVANVIIENRASSEKKAKTTGNTEAKPKKSKARKSSIKPAKEIKSEKSDQIIEKLNASSHKKLRDNDEILGKKSLAYLVWALGHAKLAEVNDGLSVHDVSALLYQSSKIQLYPINISRVLKGNAELVSLVSSKEKTKTYLLSPKGEQIFSEKFL